MKKTILGVGTLVSIIAPVAAVVSCSEKDFEFEESNNMLLVKVNNIIPENNYVMIADAALVANQVVQEYINHSSKYSNKSSIYVEVKNYKPCQVTFREGDDSIAIASAISKALLTHK